MALRQIRIDGDPILRKRSREVEEDKAFVRGHGRNHVSC